MHTVCITHRCVTYNVTYTQADRLSEPRDRWLSGWNAFGGQFADLLCSLVSEVWKVENISKNK